MITMKTKKLFSLFLFFTAFLNAQEKLIIGTWNTVTVSNDMFQMNENKEFELTKKGKIIHNSKDAILNLKLGYSENQFFFDENNNFFVKLSENSKFFVFKGKYEVDEQNNTINLTLTNSAGSELKKYFKYSFNPEDQNYMKLDVYFGGEPTKYLLKRN